MYNMYTFYSRMTHDSCNLIYDIIIYSCMRNIRYAIPHSTVITVIRPMNSYQSHQPDRVTDATQKCGHYLSVDNLSKLLRYFELHIYLIAYNCLSNLPCR